MATRDSVDEHVRRWRAELPDLDPQIEGAVTRMQMLVRHWRQARQATYAALGAMMAVHARTRTGRGQVVDSAIYEAVLAMMESLVSEYQQGNYSRERTGAILPNIAPSNVYPTRDGIVPAAVIPQAVAEG